MKTSAIFATCVTVLCLFGVSASGAQKTALKVLRYDEPLYPQHLLQRGIIRGEVNAIVSVDAVTGKVGDALICGYSHPDLIAVTEKMLRTIVYQPFTVGDAPQSVRFGMTVTYEAKGTVISQTVQDSIDAFLQSASGSRYIDKMVTKRDLDGRLIATHVVQPGAPVADAEERVTLDFLIDETGRVRMPALARGDNLALAEAAADALLEWQFTPPTRKGQPVIVRAKQEFVFKQRT